MAYLERYLSVLTFDKPAMQKVFLSCKIIILVFIHFRIVMLYNEIKDRH